MARVSDATIKFLETAWQTPSRKTLLSLFAIPALRLKWQDFANFGGPEPEAAVEPPSALPVAPPSDPVQVTRQTADLGPPASAHSTLPTPVHARLIAIKKRGLVVLGIELNSQTVTYLSDYLKSPQSSALVKEKSVLPITIHLPAPAAISTPT